MATLHAIVKDVRIQKNGSGVLELISDPNHADKPVPTSMELQTFARAQPGVERLKGKKVWGGNNFLCLNDDTIADRLGPTQLAFKPGPVVQTAVDRDDVLAAGPLPA